MALKLGAALVKIGSIAGRVICAIPERRNGLRIGLNTASVGKPNEIVVDNYGRRYAGERRITKDPSRYHFYKEALHFDGQKLEYPRIPSWMVFDSTLMRAGPIVRVGRAAYIGVDWGDVDCVIQMGAPKGSSRLLQRIGRANHRLEEASEALIVPGNRFEYLQALAAWDAIREGVLDGEPFRTGSLEIGRAHV